MQFTGVDFKPVGHSSYKLQPMIKFSELAPCILLYRDICGRNFMKERHLSKKSFLTFVYIVIDYTKPPGIVQNSKKVFL